MGVGGGLVSSLLRVLGRGEVRVLGRIIQGVGQGCFVLFSYALPKGLPKEVGITTATHS